MTDSQAFQDSKEAIIDCVFAFIDRMNDVCDSDNADCIQSHSDVVGIGCCLGDNGICRDGIRYVRLTANDTCARWSCVSKEQTTLRSTTYTAFDGLVHVLLRDRIHCLGRVTR